MNVCRRYRRAMQPLLTDPLFYLVAVPAVTLVGLSKGGLGGAFALIGMPIMALAVPPLTAAAILLPILIAMDMVSLWAWRGYFHTQTLKHMLPGAMLGIAIGWATAALVTDAAVRLIVGSVALVFVLRWIWQQARDRAHVAQPGTLRATFWATASGFTSFVAHAGGPPFQIYALPLKLDPRVYVGTSVIYFSIVNAVKLLPYFLLGQFSTSNLAASAILMPIAPAATLAGAWLVRRIKPEMFYPFMYAMVALVSIKLVFDGIQAFF